MGTQLWMTGSSNRHEIEQSMITVNMPVCVKYLDRLVLQSGKSSAYVKNTESLRSCASMEPHGGFGGFSLNYVS